MFLFSFLDEAPIFKKRETVLEEQKNNFVGIFPAGRDL
jgi:hypothetical protein